MENTVLFRKINGWMTVVWTVMIPVSIMTGWINSVPFISAISLYALITGHLSTWQSARVEVRQEEESAKKDDNFEGRVEKKVDEIKQDASKA